MSITWADVVKIAPALSTLSVETQTLVLAQVALMLNAKQFGTKLDMASTYLAAHMGTIVKNGGNGPGGPISAESTGRVSRSYAVPPASDPYWDKTSFGQTFRWVMKTLPGRVGFVT